MRKVIVASVFAVLWLVLGAREVAAQDQKLVALTKVITPERFNPEVSSSSGNAHFLANDGGFVFRQSNASSVHVLPSSRPNGDYAFSEHINATVTYDIARPTTMYINHSAHITYSPDSAVNDAAYYFAVVYNRNQYGTIFVYPAGNYNETLTTSGTLHLSPGRHTLSFIGMTRLGGFKNESLGTGGALSSQTAFSATFEPSCEGLLPLVRPTPDPQDEYVTANVNPELLARVDKFRSLIKAEDPFALFKETSGYRTPEYQQHFIDIKKRFLALAKIKGIESYGIAVGEGKTIGRLQPSGEIPLDDHCLSLMKQVNDELDDHGILADPANHYAPYVSETKKAHTVGEAVDISISTILTKSELQSLTALAGLKVPPKNDKVHYERSEFKGGKTLQFVGNSPIDLLITDPSGKRIGFDPITNELVNDFGDTGFYSGVGTEPQYFQIDYDAFAPGDFTVGGVGTGDGPYTVVARAWSEEFDGEYEFESVIANGVATHLQMLEAVTFNVGGHAGDFNEDGLVDGADLTQWREDYGLNGDSDGDGDGDTDGNDLLVWQRSFATIAATSVVPEPSACVIALIVVCLGMMPGVGRKSLPPEQALGKSQDRKEPRPPFHPGNRPGNDPVTVALTSYGSAATVFDLRRSRASTRP